MPKGATTRTRIPVWRKKALLAKLESGSSYAQLLSENPDLSLRTLERVKHDKARLDSTEAVDKRGRKLKTMNMGHGGRKPMMPFQDELLALVQSVREKGKSLALLHLKEFIRRAHPQWLADYIASRKAANRVERHADALDAMCRAVVQRHDYTYRRATTSKYIRSELATIKRNFAKMFWAKYAGVPSGSIQFPIYPLRRM